MRLAVLLLAALVGCTSVDERLVQDCRARGFVDGTAAMSDCVQRLADMARAERPPGIPPTFGGRIGCYPSWRSGVVC